MVFKKFKLKRFTKVIILNLNNKIFLLNSSDIFNKLQV